MFQLINSIILEFRSCFKREKTWHWFAVLVFGFMTRGSQKGITSIISSLRLTPLAYHNMLHFFRSTAFSVESLYDRWIKIVASRTRLTRVAGRILLLGDHSKVPKEGLRMPDIQILHQDSQNSGKPEYIAGHNYGQVSAVITNGIVSRSIPLETQLQKSPPRVEGTKKPNGDTLVTQMLNLVSRTAISMGESVVVALDAYFCKRSAWDAIEKTRDDGGKRRVELVTRAPSDTVAYTVPEAPARKKRGHPRIYGDRVPVYAAFSDTSEFSSTDMRLYGEKITAQYLCRDLIWRPIKGLVRFVWLKSKRGSIVLMSSDLTLSPLEIIEAYGLRFKIEAGFNEQKHDMGCFAYHFWTAGMPRRKRNKKSEEPSDPRHQDRLNDARRATQAYVCLSTVATGILTIIAFSHNSVIWQRYPGWVRTLRTSIPSISVVKETLAQDYYVFLEQLKGFRLFKIIISLRRTERFLYENAV